MASPAYELAPCVVCGRADGEMLAGPDEVRAEVEALWDFHQRRLRAGTPPASLLDRVAFSQDPPLRVARCGGCGLVYRNPVERASELRETYARDEVDAGVLRALHETQRPAYRAQARRLTRVRGRAGSGLEVGSYVGAFLAAAGERGWRFQGVDVNPHTNAFTRGLGFQVADGTIEAVAAERPGLRLDAVAIWNCLDQLADPRAAVRAARRVLAPAGVLAVRVPNGAFYAAWRRRLRGPAGPLARALLAQNNLLAFPYRFGFTPAALARLLEAEGLAVRLVFGDSLVPIADRWTRPWAAAEERVVKGALRAAARAAAASAPWIEVYAARA
ncbi:MAG TPA: methyltransferase domain-containing protein [Gemmatimonadaceae bacterium]|nr:methyltransferase domain-containing protein [Gemmatimonadaceae bacterium]